MAGVGNNRSWLARRKMLLVLLAIAIGMCLVAIVKMLSSFAGCAGWSSSPSSSSTSSVASASHAPIASTSSTSRGGGERSAVVPAFAARCQTTAATQTTVANGNTHLTDMHRQQVFHGVSATPGAQFYFLSDAMPPRRHRAQYGIGPDMEVRDISLTNLWYVLLADHCVSGGGDGIAGDGSDGDGSDGDGGDNAAGTVGSTKADKMYNHNIHGAGDTTTTAVRRALVADIGANVGYFGLYAAALGCRVLSLEVQRHLSSLATASYAINGFMTPKPPVSRIFAGAGGVAYSPRVCNICGGAAATTGGVMPLAGGGEATHFDVDSSGHGQPGRTVVTGRDDVDHRGYALPSGAWSDIKGRWSKNHDSLVVMYALDDLIADDDEVLLWKLDVEGYEAEAVRGAHRLLVSRRVRNIAMEFVPSNLGGSTKAAALVDKILAYGFGGCLFPKSQDSDSTLPPGAQWGRAYLEEGCKSFTDGTAAVKQTMDLPPQKTDIWFRLLPVEEAA